MAVSKMKAHRSEQPHPKTAGILYFLNVTLLSPCIGAPGDMFANARSLPIRQKPPTNPRITVLTPIPTLVYA
jgi:hypothetical protein